MTTSMGAQMLAYTVEPRPGSSWDEAELQALFQPIENLATDEIVGFEALARLRRDGVLLAPDAFLPLLDRQDRMGLFQTMLREANALLNSVRRDPVYVSVNVETSLLETHGFLRSLADTLHNQHYVGKGLVLEILESEQASDLAGLQDLLPKIKALGIGIALDDVGSGFSSLMRLRDLPIDIMKLDQTFARGLTKRPEDLQYIASLLSLARGLKKRLIVEGAETDDIRQALRVLGVEYAQGYAIAKPMPASEVDTWLKARSTGHTIHGSATSLLASFASHVRNASGRGTPADPRSLGPEASLASACVDDGTRDSSSVASIHAAADARSLDVAKKLDRPVRSSVRDRLSVVIIDDDPIYRSYVVAMMSKDDLFVVHEGSDGDDLNTLLENEKIDCIVLDYNLNGDSGFAVRERLLMRFPDLPPVLILTSDERQSTVIKAMRLGIQDYLPKAKLKPDALVAAVTRIVHADRGKRQLAVEHRKLVAAFNIDCVTGLPSRWRLEERIAQVAGLAPAVAANFVIAAIQMLEWHNVIERFGFDVANQALRAFGERLRLCSGQNDICGRHTDGTFMVVVDLRSLDEDLVGFCTRIVRQLSFQLQTSAATLVLNARVGIASCAVETASAETLVDNALDVLDNARAPTNYQIAEDLVRTPTMGSGQTLTHRVAANPDAFGLRTSDRRREPRHKVFRLGRILTMGKASVVDCTVKNMSTGGAGLRLHAVMVVSPEFVLEIGGSGEARKVRLKWQTGLNLGVEYIE